MVVQAHIEGAFGEVLWCRWHRFLSSVSHPTDDGITKFGDEQHNGTAHHYPFNGEALEATANRISALADTPVYGGDAIVTAEGAFYIIDFNDWPSFSRCRDEAAKAIKAYVVAQRKI